MAYLPTRRFRSRARIITAAAFVAAAVVILGGAVAIAATDGPRDGLVVAYAVTVFALAGLIGSFGAITALHVRTLRALAQRHPDDVVMLSRRLPPVSSDLPMFLRSKGLDGLQIGDGWYATLVDARGISVHSPGRDPQELVLMEWAEVGAIELVRTATVGGESRWSITVDVKPYPTPMTVDVAGAAGIVTMPLDAADIRDLIQAVETRRPT